MKTDIKEYFKNMDMEEIKRHASVSIRNNCPCTGPEYCFCCQCKNYLKKLEEKKI